MSHGFKATAARTSRPLACGPLALILAAALGCPKAPPPTAPKAAAPMALRVLVVDDRPLAAALGRLQGEWQAQGGGPLEVAPTTAAELTAAKGPEADVLVFPATELGVLAERGWLVSLERDVQTAPGYQWNDVFPQLREVETRWGPEIVAVPLGSPVLLLVSNRAADAPPPARPLVTWSELLAWLAAEPPEGAAPRRVGLPLAEGWAGQTLLAWAAPYVRHPDYYSGLFNKDTLEPQIAGPPFVRALEELVAACKHGHPDQLQFTAADAWRAVRQGDVELAIAWPSGGGSPPAVDAQGPADLPAGGVADRVVSFAPLPGSAEAYNPLRQTWDALPGGPQRAPLVGSEGRLAGVSSTAADAATAFGLIALASGPTWSGEVAPASAATAPFRGRHLGAASGWAGGQLTAAEASSYAAAVADSLSAPRALAAVRIPGYPRYLAALDEAVRQAAGGQITPQVALEQAADRWRAITAELGLDAQRAAYQRSLGLAPR